MLFKKNPNSMSKRGTDVKITQMAETNINIEVRIKNANCWVGKHVQNAVKETPSCFLIMKHFRHEDEKKIKRNLEKNDR